MSMFQCHKCGNQFVGDSASHGMKIRCPICASECNEIETSNKFVCSECGLSYGENADRCAACGGKIIPMSEQKDDATALSKEENDDLYVMNWERNLGGYAFQVIIGLTFAVVCGLWYTIEVVRSDFFSMEVGNSLWFPLCFELIANPIMAVLAAVILMGFFRRKSWVPNVLSRYFKVYGILMLIDFVWVLLVLETIVPNAVSEFNGCEVGRPFGCFFWAWYFRRLFSKSAK